MTLMRSSRSRRRGQTVETAVNSLVATIIERGILGLEEALAETNARAKKHAPVRAIFRARATGPADAPRGLLTMPKGLRRAIGETEDIRTLASIDQPSRGAFVRSNKAYLQATGNGPARHQVAPGSAGHANSFQPVFQAGGRRFQGNFRSVGMSGQGHTLAPVSFLYRQSGSIRVMKAGVSRGEAESGVGRSSFYLNTRGRYEVRTGRANFMNDPNELDVRGNEAGETAGGRLRGEIHVQPPVMNGSLIMGYVVSPTPYARFQEFGTSHNRSHPFLRPALYEARSFLPKYIRRALIGGRRYARTPEPTAARASTDKAVRRLSRREASLLRRIRTE